MNTENRNLKSKEILEEIRCMINDRRPNVADELYEDLWKIEKNEGDLSIDEQLLVSENISSAALIIGEFKQDHMDFMGLSKCVKDVRVLWEENKKSDNITKNFIDLLMALFYLKHVFKEFFYLDEYVVEVLELSEQYADKQEIAEKSAVCIANLVELCYNGVISIDIVVSLIDRLIVIAKAYQNNAYISLVYLRTMVTFCSMMQSHFRQEIYVKYNSVLQQNLWRLNHLPTHEASELYFSISECGLAGYEKNPRPPQIQVFS
ncbi:MAG: hypothetical protein LBN95_02345 [Prevotellaceae bacterium]|jgi:hypothetical protein|nr:hypothetical protein [Prevotellaceae bacterium]